MSGASGLVPAKFLTLIAHLAITATLLWNWKQRDADYSPEVQGLLGQSPWLLMTLSFTLALIVFELFAFLTGLTMFHTTSSLLSIGCHGTACAFLSFLVFSDWSFGGYWTFALCLLPPINDVLIITDIVFSKKY